MSEQTDNLAVRCVQRQATANLLVNRFLQRWDRHARQGVLKVHGRNRRVVEVDTCRQMSQQRLAAHPGPCLRHSSAAQRERRAWEKAPGLGEHSGAVVWATNSTGTRTKTKTKQFKRKGKHDPHLSLLTPLVRCPLT